MRAKIVAWAARRASEAAAAGEPGQVKVAIPTGRTYVPQLAHDMAPEERQAEYIRAAVAVITPIEFIKMIKALMKNAKRGEINSIRLVMDLIVGDLDRAHRSHDDSGERRLILGEVLRTKEGKALASQIARRLAGKPPPSGD